MMGSERTQDVTVKYVGKSVDARVHLEEQLPLFIVVTSSKVSFHCSIATLMVLA